MDKNKTNKKTTIWIWGSNSAWFHHLLSHLLSLLGASLFHPHTILRSFLISILLLPQGLCTCFFLYLQYFPSSLNLVRYHLKSHVLSKDSLDPSNDYTKHLAKTLKSSHSSVFFNYWLSLHQADATRARIIYFLMIITLTSVHYQLLSRWQVNILSVTERMIEWRIWDKPVLN